MGTQVGQHFAVLAIFFRLTVRQLRSLAGISEEVHTIRLTDKIKMQINYI